MASRVTITNRVHNVFQYKEEPTEEAVYLCELIKERERSVLRKHLQPKTISFEVAQNTCTMVVRTMLSRTERAPGGPVLLLHAMSGKLTTGWAWTKLLEPVHKAGFMAMAMDFPGFGRSCLNGRYTMPAEEWDKNDWLVTSKALLEVLPRPAPKVRMVCVGESCTTAMGMLRHYRELLDDHQIWHNPVFDLQRAFPEVHRGFQLPACPPHKNYRRALGDLLVEKKPLIWVTYDDSVSPQTQDDLQRLAQTLHRQFFVTKVTASHMCEVQVGCTVADNILFPCRMLKRAYVAFLKGELRQPPAVLPQQDLVEPDSRCLSSSVSECPSEVTLEPNDFIRMSRQARSSSVGGFLPPSTPSGSSRRATTLTRAALSASGAALLQSPSHCTLSPASGSLPPSARSPSDGHARRSQLQVDTGRVIQSGASAMLSYRSGSSARSGATSLSSTSSFALAAKRRLLEDPARVRERRLAKVPEVLEMDDHDAPAGALQGGSGASMTLEEMRAVEDALDFSVRFQVAERQARIATEQAQVAFGKAQAPMMQTAGGWQPSGGQKLTRQAITSSNFFAERHTRNTNRQSKSKYIDKL